MDCDDAPPHRAYSVCACGHVCDGADYMLDLYHMGHRFVQSISHITEPISADLSERLIEQLIGYPNLIELVRLASSHHTLAEYNKRVVPLLLIWKAALRRAWQDFEKQRNEKAGGVHGANATVSAILSAGGAHMLELRAAPKGLKDLENAVW
jgi:hypothetical protein